MDKNLFLPLSWEELKWWVNTSKRLVNDISGGRPCSAHSIAAKVEDYFKDQLSQPFDLTPDLCGWIFCEFRNQVAKGQEEAVKEGRLVFTHAGIR
jgi:hypothetical protein